MFFEQAREVPVRYGEYDIAVAGGGAGRQKGSAD